MVTIGGEVLETQKVLSPGNDSEWIISKNQKYSLRFQGDGNLVLYYYQKPIWASNTSTEEKRAKWFHLQLLKDGNLVIFESRKKEPEPSNITTQKMKELEMLIWEAGAPQDNPGAYLIVQDDGNVVIYRNNGSPGSPAWATNTQGRTSE